MPKSIGRKNGYIVVLNYWATIVKQNQKPIYNIFLHIQCTAKSTCQIRFISIKGLKHNYVKLFFL